MNKDQLVLLEKMRSIFLEERTNSAPDYWATPETIALYDAFFARRISWKWQSVLRELDRVNWTVPSHVENVLDWGCGSGVASESLVGWAPATQNAHFYLLDRSPLAMSYSAEKICKISPKIDITRATIPTNLANTLLLVSHVLTELSESQRLALFNIAEQCAAVIWVEPGTQSCANHLVNLHEKLRQNHRIISPCTHQNRCGLFEPQNERHWCHFFAATPTEVFHDRDWRLFANTMGIDLRSLPVSWLVTERQKLEALPTHTKPSGEIRILARPHHLKGQTRVLGCDPLGVSTRYLQHKEHKSLIRSFDEQTFPVIPPK